MREKLYQPKKESVFVGWNEIKIRETKFTRQRADINLEEKHSIRSHYNETTITKILKGR